MSTPKRPLYLPFAGPTLLETPLLNKGSAFTEDERRNFNLEGLLPNAIETIDDQLDRAYQQYRNFNSDINRHIYLRQIQDTNETLFYRLVTEHISEMMPIIYTPTVGLACERFSEIYRRQRGLFIAYPDRDHLDDILNNASRHNVKVIVVTDGERILGLGDQGIGGMGIPIGKLSLYTACGGISPENTLPVVLDVGTNNQQRIDDPMYLGWRHPRISGDEYYEFIDAFISAVKVHWPHALIQFEDFAQKTALPILERYKDELCCFNDDIQGTAAVTVGSLLAACRAAGTQLCQQRVVFLGAGSAGCGIAEAIIAQMVDEGISDEQARRQVFMVDRWGLLVDDMSNLPGFQQKLMQAREHVSHWSLVDPNISLLDVINNAKPSVLIGVSGASGVFTHDILAALAKHCERPIVMPLSNPTSRAEASPEAIINATDGRALVATGSPFAPVAYKDKIYDIAQCNNSYIFPGIGLAVLACHAQRVTERMLRVASRALAECSPMVKDKDGALLPPLESIQQVSRYIAFAVAKAAMVDQVASLVSDEQLQATIDEKFWQPEYRVYKRSSF